MEQRYKESSGIGERLVERFHTARTTIKAPLDVVWELVARPEQWSDVNRRFETISRGARGDVTRGERFTIEARDLDLEIRVIHWEVRDVNRLRHVAYRATHPEKPMEEKVFAFSFTEGDGGVELVCRMRISPSSRLRTALFLMFFQSEGKLARELFLNGVRRAAEARAR